MKIKKLLATLLLGAGLMSGTIVSSHAEGVFKLSEYTLDTLEDAKSIEIMTYTMPNVQGKLVDATALVLFPNTETPKDGWRVVVWGHGTVGVGDSCAPSLEMLNTGFRLLASSLLNAGYVVVAPDYEGLGGEGIHPYLNLESEAQSMIHAVKTLQHQHQDLFQGDWMVVGQSQGGQAALGTAEYANQDATFKGAVAGAPASHLNKIIQNIAPIALTKLEEKENAKKLPLEGRNSIYSYATLLSYGAFIGLGLRSEYPEFDYLSLFLEPARSIAHHAEGATGGNGLCLGPLRELFIDSITQYLNNNPGANVMSYPGLDVAGFDENRILQDFFTKNQPGTKQLTKPILVIHGEMDTNVPISVTEEMVAGLIDLGSSNVQLIKVPDAAHRDAIVWRNNDVVAFIKKHMPAR